MQKYILIKMLGFNSTIQKYLPIKLEGNYAYKPNGEVLLYSTNQIEKNTVFELTEQQYNWLTKEEIKNTIHEAEQETRKLAEKFMKQCVEHMLDKICEVYSIPKVNIKMIHYYYNHALQECYIVLYCKEKNRIRIHLGAIKKMLRVLFPNVLYLEFFDKIKSDFVTTSEYNITSCQKDMYYGD